MRWRTAVATSLLASLTFVAPTPAQLSQDDAELLQQVAKTYSSLTNYLFEGTINVVTRGQGEPQLQQIPFLVAADALHLRDECASPTIGGLILANPKETIVYNIPLGQYKRVADGGRNRGIGSTVVDRYKLIAEGATSARHLTPATLLMEGRRRDCTVLEVTYKPTATQPGVTELPRTYWIENRTHLVLMQRSTAKMDHPQLGKIEQEEEMSLRRAQIDPKLPDSLWTFRPASNAKEVTEFTNPMDQASTDAIAGKPAIDFTLKDLKGRPHSLKGLRGKVVLLDFWATWCGPCRLTMPRVDKIHKDYRNRGVEVMSINVGETATKAGAYINKNGYAFTTLLDPERDVATKYRVNGIPTLVVIDRSGKVTDYLVGAHDDVTLRSALAKAGVK